MSNTTNPIVCRLCGETIEKVKGEREEAYKQELSQQIHRSCSEKYKVILAKHKVRQEDYTSALIEAITQMLRLENTDAMKNFNKRTETAQSEANKEFPYMATMAQKAQAQQQQPLQTIEVKRAPETVEGERVADEKGAVKT